MKVEIEDGRFVNSSGPVNLANGSRVRVVREPNQQGQAHIPPWKVNVGDEGVLCHFSDVGTQFVDFPHAGPHALSPRMLQGMAFTVHK